MKNSCFLFLLLTGTLSSFSQRNTQNDGDWSKQFFVLKNTAEAELMIRVGDIDNLGFGWNEDFTPFSGKSTPTHGYPWNINTMDASGTDRIMVPTSFKYGNGKGSEGYTNTTERPANKPVALVLPLKELKGIKIDSAALQLFIDDFQSPSMGSKFRFSVNGTRFTQAEKMIRWISQDGPVGKLIHIRFSAELLQQLKADSLTILIDDPTTGMGDGFAIDFVKLLINPKLTYKGTISGKVIDMETRKPIGSAMAAIEGSVTMKADAEGNFLLQDIPAGLAIVEAGAAGYASSVKQADVISDEITEGVEIELKRSEKVTYNNKTLQEGDHLVMNNIQFAVSSAVLLPAGKAELNKLVALMKQKESLEILLSGHTSSEGSAGLNRELSLKRVRACKDYLASRGIDEVRIEIEGNGPDKPIAPNDTEASRAINRRVEMKITKL
jgi:outer membrane protein OmpA-like peptidoglycan-associated protein